MKLYHPLSAGSGVLLICLLARPRVNVQRALLPDPR
jgi:hypothetical protein